MKKEEVPQDEGALGKVTKEICYATDKDGHYTTELSNGWDIKKSALDAAWNNIGKRVEDARQKVLNGEASPILFFMEYRLMDLSVLAGYTGYWKWQIKRHLHPQSFNKLSAKQLDKYAGAFNVSVSDLKSMTVHHES